MLPIGLNIYKQVKMSMIWLNIYKQVKMSMMGLNIYKQVRIIVYDTEHLWTG